MRQLIALSAFALLVAIASPAQARVAGFEVISRANVAYGYERIVGRLRLAERPESPANRRIVDISLAPVDTAGDVEATADIEIVHPKNPSASNGAAIVEVPNRGAKAIIFHINESPKFGSDPANPGYWGDGFLERHGFTIVWVGWQWDVSKKVGLMGLDSSRRFRPWKTDHGIRSQRFPRR